MSHGHPLRRSAAQAAPDRLAFAHSAADLPTRRARPSRRLPSLPGLARPPVDYLGFPHRRLAGRFVQVSTRADCCRAAGCLERPASSLEPSAGSRCERAGHLQKAAVDRHPMSSLVYFCRRVKAHAGLPPSHRASYHFQTLWAAGQRQASECWASSAPYFELVKASRSAAPACVIQQRTTKEISKSIELQKQNSCDRNSYCLLLGSINEARNLASRRENSCQSSTPFSAVIFDSNTECNRTANTRC
jgi:hypothetical protein